MKEMRIIQLYVLYGLLKQFITCSGFFNLRNGSACDAIRSSLERISATRTDETSGEPFTTVCKLKYYASAQIITTVYSYLWDIPILNLPCWNLTPWKHTCFHLTAQNGNF